MNKTIAASISAVLTLSGCATAPDRLPVASVSDVQYASYSCDQIAQDSARVSRRETELHALLKTKADNDVAQAVVGAVLFWPALFALEGGDGAEAMEYSRVKGERIALERVAVERNCGIVASTK